LTGIRQSAVQCYSPRLSHSPQVMVTYTEHF